MRDPADMLIESVTISLMLTLCLVVLGAVLR